MKLMFSFGTPVTCENFYNRKKEVNFLLNRIFAIKKKARNDVAVIGSRRVGKSSLILEVKEKIIQKNMVCAFIDCEGLDFTSFVQEFNTAVLSPIINKKIKIKLREMLKEGARNFVAVFSEVFGRVKGIELSSPKLLEVLKLRIEFEKEASGKKKEFESLALLKSTLSLAEDTGNFVIFFDEFQDTIKYKINDTEFLAVLRRLIQYQKKCVFVYTGSSIGMMKDIFSNTDSPFAGNADILYVLPFSKETSTKFLKQGFKNYGTNVEPKVLEILVKASGGYPAYLNWMGLRCIDISKKKITIQIAKKIKDEMFSPMSPLKQMIEKQLSKLGTKTRLALKAIAVGYNTPSEISDFAQLSNVYVYLNRLQKYGIIEKKNNKYYILDPLMFKSF